METYNKALEFAMKAHKGQTRKRSDTPYIVHPIRVSLKVLLETNSEILATAAVLHDVLEDTKVTQTEMLVHFGHDITKLVQEVTDNVTLKAKLGKEAYWLKTWADMSQQAKVIKFYDRLDNIKDRPTAKYVTSTLKVLKQLNTINYQSQAAKAYDELVRECKYLILENKWH